MSKYADIIGNEMTGPELSCVLKAEAKIKKHIRKVGEEYVNELREAENETDKYKGYITGQMVAIKELLRRLTKDK